MPVPLIGSPGAKAPVATAVTFRVVPVTEPVTVATVPVIVWPTTSLPAVTAVTVRTELAIVPVTVVAGVLIVYVVAVNTAVTVAPRVMPQVGIAASHPMTCPTDNVGGLGLVTVKVVPDVYPLKLAADPPTVTASLNFTNTGID